jgi:hypothetical protein
LGVAVPQSGRCLSRLRFVCPCQASVEERVIQVAVIEGERDRQRSAISLRLQMDAAVGLDIVDERPRYVLEIALHAF